MTLSLSEAVMVMKDAEEKEIPKELKLDVSSVTGQTLGVFSHIPSKYIKFILLHQNCSNLCRNNYTRNI